MTLEVRIDRLVLDGLELTARERAALPRAIERELERALGLEALADRRRTATRVNRLGAEIARAVDAAVPMRGTSEGMVAR